MNPLDYNTIQLPSRGVFYEGRIPDGKVQARHITVAEIAAFESAGGTDKLDRMLAACVKLPNGFEHKDLLMSDRMALLFALRTITMGARYNYEFVCPHCKTHNKTSVNLATELTEKTPEPGACEPFDVALPVAGVTVSLRFLRGRDEEAVAKHAKRLKLQSGTDEGDPSFAFRIAKQIVAINGEKHNILDTEDFVRKLSFRDATAIGKANDATEPGIDTTVVPECRRCGAAHSMNLELTAEFFRPSDG